MPHANASLEVRKFSASENNSLLEEKVMACQLEGGNNNIFFQFEAKSRRKQKSTNDLPRKIAHPGVRVTGMLLKRVCLFLKINYTNFDAWAAKINYFNNSLIYCK